MESQESKQTLINRHSKFIADGNAALDAIKKLGYIHSGEEHWYYVIGEIQYKIQRAQIVLDELQGELK